MKTIVCAMHWGDYQCGECDDEKEGNCKTHDDLWIGGQGHAYSTPEVREFNAGNDVEAINYVLNSGVNFWQIPNDVWKNEN